MEGLSALPQVSASGPRRDPARWLAVHCRSAAAIVVFSIRGATRSEAGSGVARAESRSRAIALFAGCRPGVGLYRALAVPSADGTTFCSTGAAAHGRTSRVVSAIVLARVLGSTGALILRFIGTSAGGLGHIFGDGPGLVVRRAGLARHSTCGRGGRRLREPLAGRPGAQAGARSASEEGTSARAVPGAGAHRFRLPRSRDASRKEHHRDTRSRRARRGADRATERRKLGALPNEA